MESVQKGQKVISYFFIQHLNHLIIMAKITGGILGGGKGKVANVVMGKWKGIDYLRGYAIPANPRSVAQTLNRKKFGLATTKASGLNLFLRTIPDQFPKQSNFNAAVKYFFSNTDVLDCLRLFGGEQTVITQIEILNSGQRLKLTGQYQNGDKIIGWYTERTTEGIPVKDKQVLLEYSLTTAASAYTFEGLSITDSHYVCAVVLRANQLSKVIATQN